LESSGTEGQKGSPHHLLTAGRTGGERGNDRHEFIVVLGQRVCKAEENQKEIAK